MCVCLWNLVCHVSRSAVMCFTFFGIFLLLKCRKVVVNFEESTSSFGAQYYCCWWCSYPDCFYVCMCVLQFGHSLQHCFSPSFFSFLCGSLYLQSYFNFHFYFNSIFGFCLFHSSSIVVKHTVCARRTNVLGKYAAAAAAFVPPSLLQTQTSRARTRKLSLAAAMMMMM